MAHDCSKIENFCKHGKINTRDCKHIFSLFVSIEYQKIPKIHEVMSFGKVIFYTKPNFKRNWNLLKSTHEWVEILFIF